MLGAYSAREDDTRVNLFAWMEEIAGNAMRVCLLSGRRRPRLRSWAVLLW
jgi:hypothetical protein